MTKNLRSPLDESPAVAAPAPSVMPSDGRRLIVYVVYDRRGEVGDYIPYALAALREHAARILVVVNGSVTEEARQTLAPVSDEILVRPNRGFDTWAHKDAIDYLGDGITDFDEVVFANDTWYGPVRPFGPLFTRMDDRVTHFWGMTDHPDQIPNPFTGTGVMARHLQSFWIAVRRPMIQSLAWRDYWRLLPEIATYNEAILRHEIVFTHHFEQRGFTSDVAFSSADYPSDNAAISHADLLVRDGCPVFKRRTLFHHPTWLIANAIIGRDLLTEIVSFGYPEALVYADLARNVAPRTLNSNLGLLSVLSGPDLPDDGARISFVVRSTRAEHILPLAPWVKRLPASVAPIILLDPDEDMVRFEALWGSAFPNRPADVRVGRGDADHPLPGADDLIAGEAPVVCVDARIWDGGDTNERRFLRRQQLESLMGRTDWITRLSELFASEAGLGVVFPLPPHVDALSEAIRWPDTRGRLQLVAERRGVRVPIDEFGPLAPAGGVWAARPPALRLFVDPPVVGEGPGLVDPVLQGGWALADLLLPYAAAERGFHARTVSTPEHASLSHSLLEYKLDRLLETTYGDRLTQIQFLQREQWRGGVSAIDLVKMYLRTNYPDGSHPALSAIRWGRQQVARGRRVAHRRGGRP